MKSIHISEDIVSLSDFKINAAKMLTQVQQSHRPIVITQNGRPAGVLISPVEFDHLSEQSRFVASVKSGLSDVEKGNVLTAKELDKVLDEATID